MPRVRQPIVPSGPLPRGNVCVLEERCKGCGLCIAFCPRHILAESPEFNTKGYHPPVVLQPDACANCQICYLICPEFAIFSIAAVVANGDGTNRAHTVATTRPQPGG